MKRAQDREFTTGTQNCAGGVSVTGIAWLGRGGGQKMGWRGMAFKSDQHGEAGH
jgi:hypothetical protein